MSKWKHWIFYMVALFWVVPAIIYYVKIDSERTKRIELEAELAGCIYSKGAFYRRLTAQELIYRDTVTINDTILAVPPITGKTWDSSIVNSPNFGIDSSEVIGGCADTIIEYDTIYLPDSTYWDLDSSYLWKVYDSLDLVVRTAIADRIWTTPKYIADSSEVTE